MVTWRALSHPSMRSEKDNWYNGFLNGATTQSAMSSMETQDGGDGRRVSIGRIVIAPINRGVDHLLDRHGRKLHLVARDPEIVNHDEFRDQGEIPRADFIAEPLANGDFRLKDGNHRAIRLVVRGEDRLSLVYPVR